MPWHFWLIWALGLSPAFVALVWILVRTTGSRSRHAKGTPVATRIAKPRRFSLGDVEGPLTECDLEERARWVSDAKQAEYLDAAFLIRYYNVDRRRWGPGPKPPVIDPAEVFGQCLDREKFADAIDHVDALLKGAITVASAHFEYPGAVRTAEEELLRLRVRFPGFSEHAYDRAVRSAMIAMR